MSAGAAEICSFYMEDGGCAERLVDHVDAMLRVYRGVFEAAGWPEAAARRLSVLGYRYTPGMLREAAYAAIVFHDVGKAFYSGPGFRGHEHISAFIAWFLRDVLAGKLGDRGLVDAVVLSILYHHTAMGRSKDFAALNYAMSSLRMHRERLRVVGEFLERYGYGGAAAELDKMIRGSLPRRVEMEYKKYYGMIHGKMILKPLRSDAGAAASLYPVALRVLRVLVVADNKAAGARGGRARVFVGDVVDAAALAVLRERLGRIVGDERSGKQGPVRGDAGV